MLRRGPDRAKPLKRLGGARLRILAMTYVGPAAYAYFFVEKQIFLRARKEARTERGDDAFFRR